MAFNWPATFFLFYIGLYLFKPESLNALGRHLYWKLFWEQAFICQNTLGYVWRIPKITNVSWKFPESGVLRWFSGILFRCCHRHLYRIIICRLIVYLNKIKSLFFCYKEVLGLLYLMIENILICCVVLPCDCHINSMYFMQHLNQGSLAFIWICRCFESGCQCCCLFLHAYK